MLNIVFEIGFVALLIVANGLFAMAEMAVVTARKARLLQKANQGDARALAALELANTPNQFLSTVQLGITLVGILAGAFGGATLARELTAYLSLVPIPAPYSEAISLGIVVLGIAYLSLVLGELAPKRLALNNPERIAAAVAIPMRLLTRLTSPIIRFLSASTDVVLRISGVRPSTEPLITEEEIRILIDQGTQTGVFEVIERDIVARLFRFGNRQVSALMTPRTEIAWLDLESAPDAILKAIVSSTHSLFPVGQASLDNLVGVVRAKEVLARCLTGQSLNLTDSLQEPLFVTKNMLSLKVLERFKQSSQRMALVIDEYGGIQGLVTHTDILEALVGDILLAAESGEPQAIQRQDGSWLVDGMLPVDELKELLRLDQLPDEERVGYQTVGGFVLSQMRIIPSESQHFEYQGLRFEVVDMDGHRVDKILVVSVRTDRPYR